jgi:hypothetical protein
VQGAGQPWLPIDSQRLFDGFNRGDEPEVAGRQARASNEAADDGTQYGDRPCKRSAATAPGDQRLRYAPLT